MEFKLMKEKMQKHFEEMVKDADHLFEAEVDKDYVWELYQNSFPENANEIYRKRRVHDCSSCRQFMRQMAGVVAIKDNEVVTIWDFDAGDDKYRPSIQAVAEYVRSRAVADVFVNKLKRIGIDKNYEQLENGQVKTWEHFCLDIPAKFVVHKNVSEPEMKAELRDKKQVFKRSLGEITQEALEVVLELIASKSLYKGEEWKANLEQFLNYKKEYETLSDEKKELYAWKNAAGAGVAIAKLRNTSMGTLLLNISEDMDLEIAVKKYEAVVAPANYKRPKAIFTEKMLNDAKKTMQELGYYDSLPRRFATLDDITVNNILFSNKDAAKRIEGVEDVFNEMAKELPVDMRKFSRVEEIDIEKFVSDVLPTVKDMEVLVENFHLPNLVSLIAPVNKDAKVMNKWGNNFTYTYKNDLADSDLKQKAKELGAKEGVLCFTLGWNFKTFNPNDFDAYCYGPDGLRIYYGAKHDDHTGGELDIDIQRPVPGKPAIEHITWTNKERMTPGVYQFFVVNYINRGGKTGFRAELEFDGKRYTYKYDKELKTDEVVRVADVTLHKDGTFSIKEYLPSDTTPVEVWGIKTCRFVPVTVMMYSPNYWDDQKGIGHKHYFFMLKDCINPEKPRGFQNEFLTHELDEHKRVLMGLGDRMRVADAEDQLSGIGFSSTRRNHLYVKVKGRMERVLKIKF